ncbi:MAG: hypothetical protein R6V10_08045 [bacterium]
MEKKKKLGEILLEAGVVNREQLKEALEDQKRYGGKLGTILLDRRFISEKDFFKALTRQLKIPAFDFSRSTIPESVIKLVPLELAEKYSVFPVAVKNTPQGKVLVVAMADPTNVEIQDEIRFTIGYKIEPALALENTIRYVIREYYYQQNAQGSYRMRAEGSTEGAEEKMPEMAIEHSRVGAPHDPQVVPSAEEDEESGPEKTEDKPQLSRELKALLRLLAKKGLINPKEYYDIFKETK